MKLKPSGYRTADEASQPGYLAKRFREIQRKQLADQLKAEAERRETDEKVLKMRAVQRRAA